MKYLRCAAGISMVLTAAIVVARSFHRFIPVVNNSQLAVVDLCLVILAVEVVVECVRMPTRTKKWRILRIVAIVAALGLSCLVGFVALIVSSMTADEAGSFTKDDETYYVIRVFPDNIAMYRRTSSVTMTRVEFADDSDHALGFVPMPVAMAISTDEYSGEYSQIIQDVRRDHPDWLTDR
ncbi:hypothetical protein O6R08_09475 [Cutibacterium equinum]|uniref:Tat pathway signal sequence domain protein n=1 Tax=Cutibacterium equinum TaxID=3016342 RepID=A0ABY7QXC9_9ACTN|nr:hypothetical protein [Cutibacterium equinum]WCC79706.1 hypothetical protein O6R08_09475 [Cutibacterium equinum]